MESELEKLKVEYEEACELAKSWIDYATKLNKQSRLMRRALESIASDINLSWINPEEVLVCRVNRARLTLEKCGDRVKKPFK